MRRIIVSLALSGLVSTSLVACDVEDPFVPGTDTTQPDTTQPDTTQPDTTQPGGDYQAVIVDDTEYFKDHRANNSASTNPCATAGGVDGAHGADIDAVGLFNGSSLIGYFDTVRLEIALTGKCFDDYMPISSGFRAENNYTNPEDVKGAPQGKLNEGFVSLEGGYVIGEFDDGAYVEPGYTIIVYEVFSNEATKEMFDVYVATDIDCGSGGSSRAGCSILIGSGKGEQSFVIPMSAF